MGERKPEGHCERVQDYGGLHHVCGGHRHQKGPVQAKSPGMDYLEEDLALQDTGINKFCILDTVTGIKGGAKKTAGRVALDGGRADCKGG